MWWFGDVCLAFLQLCIKLSSRPRARQSQIPLVMKNVASQLLRACEKESVWGVSFTSSFLADATLFWLSSSAAVAAALNDFAKTSRVCVRLLHACICAWSSFRLNSTNPLYGAFLCLDSAPETSRKCGRGCRARRAGWKVLYVDGCCCLAEGKRTLEKRNFGAVR